MQFVTGGPDIPERLLQAHEDGQVVLFCGAGISYPAGLPTFSCLVGKLYTAMGIDPDPVEESAIKAGQYDTAVGLLEERVSDGRQTVRKTMVSILTPNLDAQNAMATHEALLTLGENRKRHTRLITTNFDRLFEEVISKKALRVKRSRAPLLPVPKKSWKGLVYLHGLLTESPSACDLERLVVSSGDFGLAYLTERWAARFVSELLRNFVVCFVGYSINDTVVRYMLDAYAADRLLGESPPEVFAFGSFCNGKKEDAEREWRAKNVTPILYREHCHHAYLHKTLCAWSKTYRDGIRGKEQIVVRSAMARPLASTDQDDFVGRMIWALSDPSGLPARRFAELDPVPSLEWLEPLSEERFGHADLARFGISANGTVDKDLAFSLMRRPSPYGCAPWMTLVDSVAEPARWDSVMVQIAKWLTRHLDDPAALLWLAKRGGVLHKELARSIECKLEWLDRLEQDDDQATLGQIRENSPNAIPCPEMRTLWQLLLKGRVRTWVDDIDFHHWCEQFLRDGLTTILRLDLREKLAPRVVLQEPLTWPIEEEGEDADEPGYMSRLVEAEVALSAPHVREQLLNLVDNEHWTKALPELLNEFTGLLRDALDLMCELGQANKKCDRSYSSQPSISEHHQNRGFSDWTTLIELARDAWLATSARSPEVARIAAEAWWRIDYPVFRRLAFFAAAHGGIIPRRQALDWLLSDKCWWLWTQETLREAMRLLVSLAPRLNEAELILLENEILAGPPRLMYRDDIEPEVWARIQDHGVWLRLAKLQESGASLSTAGAERKEEISTRYPDWQIAENEQDEFCIWTGELNEGLKFVETPRGHQELIEWLKANADNDSWQQNDWSKRSRRDFEAVASALSELARQNIWPRRPWSEALHAWTEEELQRSWGEMAPVVAQSPDAALQAISHGVSHWLRALAKSFEGQETTFLTLCDRLLDLEYEEKEEVYNPVNSAINHPVGRATEALLQWWYRGPLKDNKGLGEALKPRFSRICKTRIGKLRHGRVLLAAHVIALFRVDRDWATRHMLPLFEWGHPEAAAAWEGFLWSPRLYTPLMEVFKPSFLDTANHFGEIGRHGVQYSSLLTHVAMDPAGVFKSKELAKAIAALPQEGLDNAAATLAKALEGAGEQRDEYWKNRVQPLLMNVWPKTKDVASASIAESFARVCVAAGDEFPSALEEVGKWLQKVDYPDRVVQGLHEANLHERFPKETLKFLDVIVGEKKYGPPKVLKECLRAVSAKMPELEESHQFQRLAKYLRAHGRQLD